MKKRFGFILVVILLSNLWVFPVARAAHTDAFTFMIPFQADATGANNDLADFFLFGPQQRPPTFPAFQINAIRFVISISVLRDGSLIYYDHWEDTLEPNINFRVQASTEVWGDGDPSNGAPPGFPGDVLARGDIITLDNPVPLPRVPTDFYFDGGDKLVGVGGALAVTFAPFPLPDGGILFADAWELYPTSRWGTEYVIPIEEGTRPNFSRPGVGFAVMAFNIQASEDDTDVQWDLDGDGNPDGSQTMSQGQNITIVGGVQSGAHIQASERVQVHLFVKDPGSWYQARGYTMLPVEQWSNEYLAPRSSDGDYWLYNPDPNNDLDVEAIQAGGTTTTFTIPAGGIFRFVAPPPAPDGVSSVRTGVHFRTVGGDPRPFYGVAALDEADAQDWGYALLPVANLSPQALVGWAPGNNRTPPSSYTGATPAETDAGRRASRVYVTALQDTTIFVDYDGDLAPDRSFTLTALQELDIMDDDPAQGEGDFDMTGAFLFTQGVPFIAVWGQDADAPAADPSIDVGTNIVPLRAPSIQKLFTLVEEGFDCGMVQQGHRVRFQLDAFNDSALPIPNAVVSDNLPAGVAYVTGSTTVDGAPVSDGTSGTPFPLDEGGLSIGTLDPIGQPGSQRTVTYDVMLPVDPATFINTASLQPETDPAIVALNLPFRPGGFEITKTLIDPPSGPVDPGQAVTFSVTISNTGGVDITGLPLEDRFDVTLLTFSSASVTPSTVDSANGVITWDNVAPAGLAPGAQLSLSISFTANNPISSGQTSTTNIVLSEGAQGSDGVRQAIVCGEAQVGFRAPTPTPTLTPTPTRPRDGDGDDDETPTPTPTRPVVYTPPVTAVPPTPAVLFLPETGLQSSNPMPVWPFVIFPGLGILVIVAIRRHRTGPK